MADQYDSKPDTLKHIHRVQELMGYAAGYISASAIVHDMSKLESPEKEAFDELTPILSKLTYGSEEYRASLRRLKPAIEHHYKKNRHHPEHWENGIADMTLMDLIEMLCDWKAAGERHDNGSMKRSFEVNEPRFNIPPLLTVILKNTAIELGMMKKEE